jgi:nucleotide-binding universal stress UspA family protein
MPDAIVIATDGSKQATNAVSVGAELAAKFGAEVALVHVLPGHISASVAQGLVALERLPERAREEIIQLADVERKSSTFVESISPPTWISPATLEAMGNLILDDAETLAKSRGAAKVRRAIMSGDPATCILEAARNSQARFIVMGKRGLGRLAGLLTGSVSQKVSQLADCACIIVPDSQHDQPARSGASARPAR